MQSQVHVLHVVADLVVLYVQIEALWWSKLFEFFVEQDNLLLV